MEALVDAFAWNLESDKVFTRDNGLPAFGAVDDCFPLHSSPPPICLVFLVGQLVPNRFEVLVSLLQASAGLVDGPEDGKVVDFDAHFGLMFPEELLDKENLCPKSLVCRVIQRWIYLAGKVIPRSVACDWNEMVAFLPVQKIEIGGDESNEQKRAEKQGAYCSHKAAFFSFLSDHLLLHGREDWWLLVRGATLHPEDKERNGP